MRHSFGTLMLPLMLLASESHSKDCLVFMKIWKVDALGGETLLCHVQPSQLYSAELFLTPGEMLKVQLLPNSYCYGMPVSYSLSRPTECAFGVNAWAPTVLTLTQQAPVQFWYAGLIRLEPIVSSLYYPAARACLTVHGSLVGIEEAEPQGVAFNPRWADGQLVLGEHPAGTLSVHNDLGQMLWIGTVSANHASIPFQRGSPGATGITVTLIADRERLARRLVQLPD